MRRGVVTAKNLRTAWLVCVLFVPAGCTTLAPTHSYENVSISEPGGAGDALVPCSGVPDGHGGFAFVPELPQSAAVPYDSPEKDGLTLEECITLALRNSPDILAAEADAWAAHAEKRVKGAARWPNIRVTGSYFHFQDTQRLGVPSPPGQPQYFTDSLAAADIVVRIPLYAGGRLRNEFRAGELLARARDHHLNRSREETVFNVTSTYYNIPAQKKVIESTEFSRDTLARHLARVESLIEAEKAARVDALRTGVRLADVEHRLLQERNVLDIQRRVLANLMGLGDVAADALKLAAEAPEPVGDGAPLHVETIVTRAYDQREDYAAAIAELKAQARRVDVARGEREPEMALEASYGGRWGFGGTGATQSSGSRSIGVDAAGNPTWAQTRPVPGGGSLTSTFGRQGLISQRYTLGGAEPADSFADLGRVGVTMDVPIFEGGRIRAQVAGERAKLRGAQQRLRKLEQDIRLEAETAVLNANSARERINVIRKSVAEAEASLRIERRKYDLGKGAIVDVLDAQAALLNAQTNYYRALADYHIAQAQVRLAAGDKGPWIH